MRRPSSGAIARRKTGVFDAHSPSKERASSTPYAAAFYRKREKLWRRPGVDATARIVDFAIALDAGKRWALAKGKALIR